MTWDHKQSIKEVARHFSLKLGASGLLTAYKRRRGYVTSHFQQGTITDRFSAAYKEGAWKHVDSQESLSGVGSEASATAAIVHALPELVKSLGPKILLDIGCGDWNWMQNVPLECDYIGVDVVPEVIEANRRSERPGVSFMVADAVSDRLPPADVILCREVLFHLSFEDGLRAIENMAAAAKWLILTSDSYIWFNADIPTGDFRRLNLERAPYRLPAPIRVVSDDAVSAGRILGVWDSAILGLRYMQAA